MGVHTTVLQKETTNMFILKYLFEVIIVSLPIMERNTDLFELLPDLLLEDHTELALTCFSNFYDSHSIVTSVVCFPSKYLVSNLSISKEKR